MKQRNLALTFDVECWFHSDWFNASKIPNRYKIERVVQNTRKILKLLEKFKVNGTFFVLGEVALKHPELLNEISDNGHEIASHNLTHKSNSDLKSENYESDLKYTKNLIEKIIHTKIFGYRAPNFKISHRIIHSLKKSGFLYDSSVVPCRRIPGWYGFSRAPIKPYNPSLHDLELEDDSNSFREFPISVFPKLRFPGAGGWYLRNIGAFWTKKIVELNLKNGFSLIYLHPWEIYNKNPRLEIIPFHVFRRTGDYVLNFLKTIIRTSNSKITPLNEILEKS